MKLNILLAVLLALVIGHPGCAPVGGVRDDGARHLPAGQSEVTLAAAAAPRDKAALLAEVARQTASEIRAGRLKEYADIEAFESPKNRASVSAFEPLRDAQDARLGRDKQGNLDFVRGPDGKPDLEATAKIWDETADGFARAAK